MRVKFTTTEIAMGVSVVLLISVLQGCGGSGGLSGCQCDSIECNYNEIICHLYPDISVKIFYSRKLEGGGVEYPAIIQCDIQGIDELAGTIFEDNEFLERCTLDQTTQETWPEYDGHYCRFDKGGMVGEKLSGKCAFAFTDGCPMTAAFSCTLQEAE